MHVWILNKCSDERLLQLYARGSSRAFELLYQRHKTRLFSFLMRQCSNTGVAEELAQDTWMAVIRQAENYSPKAKFVTWLFRIAHNRLVDHWRKYGARANVVTEELSEALADNHRCEDRAELAELVTQLETLPPAQLTALLLKVEGFSREEIAHITHSKAETVKSRIRYAREQLRDALEA